MIRFKLTGSLFLLIAVAFTACKKENPPTPNPTPDPTEYVISVTGTVEFPAGSDLDPNTMDIVSPIDLVSINDGSYTMETLDNQFLTQFVYGLDERVMLMGYSYPGQADFTINSRSTALALLMAAPASLLMSPAGKHELIQTYTSKPEFSDLVNMIDDLLLQDLSPLDESQTDLHQELADFYDDVFDQRLTQIGQPLQIFQNGTEITFENLGKSYSTNVGVYRDGHFVHRITMEPINFVPTGVGDVIGAVAASANGEVPTGLQPQQKTYTIPNPGEYEFRVRNGFYTNGFDNDNVAAWFDNILYWNTTLFIELIPIGDCIQPLLSDLREFVGTATTFQSHPGPGEVLGLIYNLMSEFLADALTVSTCFLNPTENDLLMDKLEKLTTITGLVGTLGHAGNVVIGLFQWYTDDGVMDVCYEYDGAHISDCGNEPPPPPPYISVLEDIHNANLGNTLNWDFENRIFPGVVVQNNEIIELHLEDKNLSTLPASVGGLSLLTELDCDENNLSSIPSFICNLTLLGDLDFRDNNISSVPSCISQLSLIDCIDIAGNNISSIPSSIGQLDNVIWLEFQDNNLTSLPASIANMDALAWLDVQNNNLDCIPQPICDLSISLFKDPGVNCGCP